MAKINLLYITVCILFSSCSTVTKDKVNTIDLTKNNNISEVLKSDPYKGLKRKVAIARFSNETRYGTSFLLDGNGDRIGKQASDILSARLTETGKFIMIERNDILKIENEQKKFGISNNLIGADYLIVGSVSEFGRKNTSEVGVFSRNKKQLVSAKVNVRLVDVKTGRIIYSEEGAGTSESEANRVFGVGAKAGFDATLDDKALSAAISMVVSNIIENLMDNPWRSSVLVKNEDNSVIIAGGKSQGIVQGDEFLVKVVGKKVKNPQTGIMITLPGQEVAKIKVINLSGKGDNEISICEIVNGDIKKNKISNYIIEEVMK